MHARACVRMCSNAVVHVHKNVVYSRCKPTKCSLHALQHSNSAVRVTLSNIGSSNYLVMSKTTRTHAHTHARTHAHTHTVICLKFVVILGCSVHKRFAQLAPDEVKADKNAKVSKHVIMDLPELKVRIWLYTYVHDHNTDTY